MRMKPVNISLDWASIEVNPTDTWEKVIVPRLAEVGVKPESLSRSVYVIRLNGNFCIEYPWGVSPVLYIGEGNFKQRVTSHRAWIGELEELVGQFSFEVRIATPRVKNNNIAYRDCEAYMIDRFGELFGSAPLRNAQFETRLCPHYVYNQAKVDKALQIGRGRRFQWAFKPMPASGFYKLYHKTIKPASTRNRPHLGY